MFTTRYKIYNADVHVRGDYIDEVRGPCLQIIYKGLHTRTELRRKNIRKTEKDRKQTGNDQKKEVKRLNRDCQAVNPLGPAEPSSTQDFFHALKLCPK
jgi:hypothetical protein